MGGLSIQIDPDGWLEAIPTAQRMVVEELLSSGKSAEEVAEFWLSQVGAQTNVGFGASGVIQTFFANVRAEFIAFVCGDARYDKERQEAVALWNGSKVALVSAVAAVVATSAGLAVVTVIPVIALLFSIVGKVGVAAFCESCKRGASQ